MRNYEEYREVGFEISGENRVAVLMRTASGRSPTEEEKRLIYGFCWDLRKLQEKHDFENHPRYLTDKNQKIQEMLDCFPAGCGYKEIPCEYMTPGFPWLIVATPCGYFKVGRRARVWELSWKDSLVTHLKGREVFMEADVRGDTVGEDYIHAWTKEDLKRYVEVLLGRGLPTKSVGTGDTAAV